MLSGASALQAGLAILPVALQCKSSTGHCLQVHAVSSAIPVLWAQSQGSASLYSSDNPQHVWGQCAADAVLHVCVSAGRRSRCMLGAHADLHAPAQAGSKGASMCMTEGEYQGVRGLTQGAQHDDLHLQLAQALAVARVGLQLLQVLPHVPGDRQAGVRAQRGRLCTASMLQRGASSTRLTLLVSTTPGNLPQKARVRAQRGRLCTASLFQRGASSTRLTLLDTPTPGHLPQKACISPHLLTEPRKSWQGGNAVMVCITAGQVVL